MHLLLIVLLVAIAGYAALLAVAWRFQERVVFQPPRGVPLETVRAMQVTYTTADGIPLFAYVTGDPERAERAVLAFHGNADLARWVVPWAARLAAEADALVMVAEYRGYDGVEGTPAHVGLAEDARAAREHLERAFGIGLERSVYYGHSLGSAVATELAAQHPPRALLLESPFTSAAEMARRFPLPGVGWLWPFVARVHYDTLRRVRDLDVPLWVVHGDADRIVPVAMGRAVFDAARCQGGLLVVHGAGHADAARVGDGDYWAFLTRACRT